MIQVDESGAEEQLPETHNVQQQGGGVSKEAEDDVLELKDREETLSSTPTQQGRMEGGFLGFQETPFDSKTISKITCLNKYTIINLLASHAYLSANTI